MKTLLPSVVLFRHNVTQVMQLLSQKVLTALVATMVLNGSASDSAAPLAPGQWTAERARTWQKEQPWLVGCNFLPSTAVNDVEMWQAETFDSQTIDRELGWAQELGFNSVRVFLNFVVWREDPKGLKRRFAEFLQIAHRRGISVMPILFDDCNFAGRVAAPGKQPDPVPGVHNSQWVSSPPLAMVTNHDAWPELERYVKDMVGGFRADRKIVVWDLYNEPGNSGLGAKSQPLMEAAFAWARTVKPVQPLTTGAWEDLSSPFARRMMGLSDVVSYHGYDSVAGVEAKLKTCAAWGRPVLCTEWLLRRDGNIFETLLPLFRDRKIGCWNWGLVAGRTQTYLPWDSKPNAPEPLQWQHDILRRDGTPFRAKEVQFIKVTTGRLQAKYLPQPVTLEPGTETGQQCVNPQDQAVMVWVSAGEFLMGRKDGREDSDERPQRKVYLDGYWMYKNSVTVGQYRKFCAATKHAMPPEPSWKWQDDNPVVNVTWDDADAYTKWAGVALPTEAQWEKAARGTDGRIYPWGDVWDAAKCVNGFNSGHRTQPGGSIPADISPYGCLEMVGNVWQWCADWYYDCYYRVAPAKNPTGPAVGIRRVIRGGSWYFEDPYDYRTSYRAKGKPSERINFCGFRGCSGASSAPAAKPD